MIFGFLERYLKRILTFLKRWWPTVLVIIGISSCAYPVLMSFWEAYDADRGISAITQTYDSTNKEERKEIFSEAVAYNRALVSGGVLEREPYVAQLAYDGSDMMAYISIPQASIRLPIYHGTDENTLMAGVGHLEGTSLPVGGESTHCVLTAHTGMPNRRMFDDIRVLENGDVFSIWVLGYQLCYEVYDIEVVTPDKTESLAIQDGEDLVTLVTCTPYGVNSHRLLVHAKRCERDIEVETVADVEVYVNRRTIPLLVCIIIIILFAVLGVVFNSLSSKKSSGKKKKKKRKR